MAMYQSLQLATPLGDIELSPAEANHVYVSSLRNQFIVVNGVEIYFSMHVEKYDGIWQLSRDKNGTSYNMLYTSRFHHNGDVSYAARKKILKVLLPIVGKYLDEHTDILVIAERAEIERNIESIDYEISKITTKLAELQMHKDELLVRLANL